MNLFPGIKEIDVLEERNPNYLHSLWLAFWFPAVALPEIVWKSIGIRLWSLLKLYGTVALMTVTQIGMGFLLLFYATVGVFWKGVTGHMGARKQGESQ